MGKVLPRASGVSHALLSCKLLVLAFSIFFLTAGAAFANIVKVAWDPNPEAVSYRLYIGPASGVYTHYLDTYEPAATLELDPGTYYAVVTAFNAAGLESDPSNEIIIEVTDSTGCRTQSHVSCGEGKICCPDLSSPAGKLICKQKIEITAAQQQQQQDSGGCIIWWTNGGCLSARPWLSSPGTSCFIGIHAGKCDAYGHCIVPTPSPSPTKSATPYPSASPSNA